MSARRKRVISTDEIQFNHKPAKMLLTKKKKGVSQNGQTPTIIGICSYCVLDRAVFELNQVLLHPELTLWWFFFFAYGAHHNKPHSPTHQPPDYWSNLPCDRPSTAWAYSEQETENDPEPSVMWYLSGVQGPEGCIFIHFMSSNSNP